MKKALLLSMPFGALERQALGLSLFKARLAEGGVPCEVRYLTFAFADLIGAGEYCWLSTDLPHTAFAGEWVFTPCLYGPDPAAQAGYVRAVLQSLWRLDHPSIERVLRIQQLAPHFLEHCLATVPWDDYSLVGFTSTFEQNIASLALARRVKAAHPEIRIVFGGANWEGEMGLELHRRFPFVDYGFMGEADESFPALARLLSANRPDGKARAAIPGLIYRANGRSVLARPPKPVQDLDTLPIPDYSDYFRDLDRSSAGSLIVPTLLFEGARGCWWGAKHQCLFCGLNGGTMAFRAKSAARALKEIQHLVDRWQLDFIQAVDNVVPMTFFGELFPALARAERPVRLFYEIRANLSRAQVYALRDAGVVHVQPGVESLNNHILDLMRKGTTALQNVQLLRWCQECGIRADYNLLFGFPGETELDYGELFRLLRAVRFLSAPTACGPIRLDRFSPYFQNAHAHGFRNVRPMLPYRYLYPFGDESVRKIAYFFEYDLAPGATAPGRSAELVRWVEDWKSKPERGTLQSVTRPDGSLTLLDTRSQARRAHAVLKGLDKCVYEYCDSVRTLVDICNHLAERYPRAGLRPDAVRSFLDALVAHGYMIVDGPSYLSLALRSPPAAPATCDPPATRERILEQAPDA